MPNHLAGSNSPYLLQHQDNPVDWYPWGAAALQKAQQEDKPIFLSIGYAACHWCHVMAHESFEDPAIAEYMNAHFVSIKVDREERPDLDGIYMQAVVTLTGSGGWPLSAFLTPDGQPFLGGTYFPPVARHNLPSFRQVLEYVAKLWAEERDKALQAAADLAAHLEPSNVLGPASGTAQKTLDAEVLDRAAMTLAQSYDWTHGGWGRAPKFPQPMALEFLLGRAAGGDRLALDIARHALKAMARGGMCDVLGGGFARYSVDDFWRVPHFEKMLYDNAQLARAYLHGYLVSGDEAFRQVCTATLDFIARELRDPAGGFTSSLDADSEGDEGKYYVWTKAEIEKEIGEPEIRDLFIAAYGISETGNFEGKNILQRVQSDEELAATFNLQLKTVTQRLKAAHRALLAARGQRVRPGIDDKALTAWNGLALVAFAEAARYLKRPDYLEIAQANANFLLKEMVREGRLLRSWRAESAAHNGYLEDYAALILGLLALYQSDPDPRWFAAAEGLAEEMLAHFRDPAGGFFDTRDDHEKLITRPKDLQDNATPCGNSLAALALLQLAAYTGRGKWRQAAEESLAAIQDPAARYPTAFANWLCALNFALAEGREIALIGEPGAAELGALAEVVWAQWRPFDVLAAAPHPPPSDAPPLLVERPLLDGRATAYVCRGFVCQRPVNTPEGLRKQLNA